MHSPVTPPFGPAGRKRPRLLLRQVAQVVCAAALLLAGPACTEHLPAYEDPRDLFQTTLTTAVVYRSDAVAIDIMYQMVNRFDETLDEVIALEGEITVQMGGDESTRRTFVLTTGEMTARSFVPGTRRLMIDPGDTVTFRVRYNFFDDSGRNLTEAVMRWRQDPSCGLRLISENISYLIRAQVRLYPRTDASVASPLIVGYCVPMPWVSDKVCPDRVQPGVCP